MSAGGRTEKKVKQFKKEIQNHVGSFEIAETLHEGHAAELASQALENGFMNIIAIGGDGTINEVINGMMKNDQLLKPQAALGIIPAGTGGDFKRNFNLTGKFMREIERISIRRTQNVDVGKARFKHNMRDTERYFVNISSLGVSAKIARSVNEMGIWKKSGGKAAFLGTAINEILKDSYYSMTFAWKQEEMTLENVNLAAIANGQYFGGGMKVAPHASLTDGLFDVIIIHDFKSVPMILNNLSIYRGTHLKNDRVKSFKTDRLSITCKPLSGVEMDGEVPGHAPVDYTCLKHVLPVIV